MSRDDTRKPIGLLAPLDGFSNPEVWGVVIHVQRDTRGAPESVVVIRKAGYNRKPTVGVYHPEVVVTPIPLDEVPDDVWELADEKLES